MQRAAAAATAEVQLCLESAPLPDTDATYMKAEWSHDRRTHYIVRWHLGRGAGFVKMTVVEENPWRMGAAEDKSK